MRFCIRCGAEMREGVCPRCGFVDDSVPKDTDVLSDTGSGSEGNSSVDNGNADNGSADYGSVNDNGGMISGGESKPESGTYYNPYASGDNGTGVYGDNASGSAAGNPFGSASGNVPGNGGSNDNGSNSKLFTILIILLAAFVAVIIIAVVFNFKGGDSEGRGAESSEISSAETESKEDTGIKADTSEESVSQETSDSEYYSFADDIKTDLDYSVKKKHYSYKSDNDNVKIEIDYPEVTDDGLSDVDDINANFAYEIDYYKDYYEKKYASQMTDDGYYKVDTTCYVTYMDKDMLSVAFMQDMACDKYVNTTIYSVNIDMTTGKILDNTDIINADDTFAADFIKRSEKQNGDSLITGWDEKDVTKALSSEDSLILVYTPVGMEIGINGVKSNGTDYDDTGWVSVTYKDYEKYLKQ